MQNSFGLIYPGCEISVLGDSYCYSYTIGQGNFICAAHSIEKLHFKKSTGTSLSQGSVPVILDNPQNTLSTVFMETFFF